MNLQLDTKDLDPQDRKDLEALATRTGKRADELLRELVHEALVRRRGNGAAPHEDEDMIRTQQVAIEELHRELDDLPPEGPEDGFSGRDHDEVLYGHRAAEQNDGLDERRS